MDKLTAIKVFLTVAENRSFTAAAEQLNISKPMISRYVTLMEEWLNARLFQRSTRKVSLTEAGELSGTFLPKNDRFDGRYGTSDDATTRGITRFIASN